MNRPKINTGCAAPAGLGALLLLLGLLLGGCLPPIVPPGPEPKPDPVIVVPVPTDGFRVLIVYDSTADMSAEQVGTIHGTKLAALLNAKCVKTASGLSEWRAWDKGSIDEAGLAAESEVWRTIWKGASSQLGTLPAIVMVSGNKSRVIAMPATEAETLKLIGEAK